MNQLSTRPWYSRIGPGLITACVVIGPGSVLSSSQVGAAEGYSRNWIVVVAALFMMVYVTLAARLGVAGRQSPATLVAQRAGRPLAALIGVSVFFIAALFQFGNNLGAQAALGTFVDAGGWQPVFDAGLLIALNGLSLIFLFGFRNLYKALERLMMALVAVMLLSFAVNLAMARPNVPNLLAGFVPSWSSDIDISVLGMVGTTFIVAAAFLQSYLVQQKGWGKEDVKQGLIDARIGASIMMVITLMIVSTSAAVFFQPAVAASTAGAAGEETAQPQQVVRFGNVGEVADQLRPLLGDWGQIVFCLGVFAAAYSSFLVNSMVGGFILSDGLGLGSKPDEPWPRLLTAVVLIVGMIVAFGVILLDISAVPAIITAQALTVVASPLLAAVLLWLTNVREVMGTDHNRLGTNVAAAAGLGLLLAMAYYTAAHVIPDKYRRWNSPTEEPPSTEIEASAKSSRGAPAAPEGGSVQRRPRI